MTLPWMTIIAILEVQHDATIGDHSSYSLFWKFNVTLPGVTIIAILEILHNAAIGDHYSYSLF